ncbi:DUF4233 domain-containing protein [Phycicoccus endophyticus]|uniref:DUF4233 domain-containing protein n=1 Tax=Phycicoccus endophyticus TaxID=1690220 RepID=A0A7G9R3N7_9MICO|nr:DUF4233 domain-containing protein [Phycicoccus endophyticus]NHI18031.1 DUF4233 domain-containing protein [Phycicoccus endophyticus]QNN50212.1 DUF4233 domain-containing protein [Phycicoccus endophyticus]GGL26980.1 hypothetical protein GCM10012283_06510 [Phycicoccus endophyticus]
MSGLPLYGRQGRLTFRLLAVALGGQAVVLFFFALVARALAVADSRPADGDRLLWVGVGLAVLALLGAGLMRRPVGITVGWLVQALTWASALLVTAMVGVAVVFTAVWVLLLVQGLRADALVARHEAQAAGSTTPGAD